MLTDPSIEKLKEKSASPYDLTVLVSKRARELTDGAQPMIDAEGAANVVSLACREVAADKVVAVKGDVEDEAVIPITREEKIRRREEAENRRKMLEEERAERMSARAWMTLSTLWQAEAPKAKKRKSYMRAMKSLRMKTKNNPEGV